MISFFDRYESYSDSFNYYNLITKINPFYKLYFDKIEKLFVVVNSAKNNQICLKLTNFNDNIANKLLFTRIENSKTIYDYIENLNNEIDKNNRKNSLSSMLNRTEEVIKFSKRTNHISNSDTKKIIEGKHA